MTNEEIIKGLQATNEHIGKHFNEDGAWMAEFIDNAIKELEQQRWIPVSEELPKKSGKYWCTFGGTNLTGIDNYTTEPDAKKLFDNSEEYTGWQSQNVLAWMPLPQPYEESEEEE